LLFQAVLLPGVKTSVILRRSKRTPRFPGALCYQQRISRIKSASA
jgi:hypothetical protein